MTCASQWLEAGQSCVTTTLTYKLPQKNELVLLCLPATVIILTGRTDKTSDWRFVCRPRLPRCICILFHELIFNSVLSKCGSAQNADNKREVLLSLWKKINKSPLKWNPDLDSNSSSIKALLSRAALDLLPSAPRQWCREGTTSIPRILAENCSTVKWVADFKGPILNPFIDGFFSSQTLV